MTGGSTGRGTAAGRVGVWMEAFGTAAGLVDAGFVSFGSDMDSSVKVEKTVSILY